MENKILKDMFMEGKIFIWIIVGYLFADFLGAIVWAMSGQIPVDNFFLGSLTRFIIQAILW